MTTKSDKDDGKRNVYTTVKCYLEALATAAYLL